MTTNRLAKPDTPAFTGRTAQEICDQGNEYVRKHGRAHEVEWRVENGRAVIDWIREPRRRQIGTPRQPYADHD